VLRRSRRDIDRGVVAFRDSAEQLLPETDFAAPQRIIARIVMRQHLFHRVAQRGVSGTRPIQKRAAGIAFPRDRVGENV
jgi:hypothetical protein